MYLIRIQESHFHFQEIVSLVTHITTEMISMILILNARDPLGTCLL